MVELSKSFDPSLACVIENTAADLAPDVKVEFVLNVFAFPAAIDVHDYVASYLVRALRFTSENVKALSSED